MQWWRLSWIRRDNEKKTSASNSSKKSWPWIEYIFFAFPLIRLGKMFFFIYFLNEIKPFLYTKTLAMNEWKKWKFQNDFPFSLSFIDNSYLILKKNSHLHIHNIWLVEKNVRKIRNEKNPKNVMREGLMWFLFDSIL